MPQHSSTDDVLDIGCGTGQTTRDAARRVPDGEALGVDLSSAMIAYARRRAAAEGVPTARFEQADAQIHPFPAGGYDVAISRMGATFFGDPNVGFANIARAVRPGGRLALLAWQGAGNNEWATSLTAALAGGRPLPTPPANVPGPFALADPSRARAPLTQAGFARSEIDGMREPMDIGSDVTEAFAFALGLLGWMLEGLDGDGRARALEALHATLSAHETANGVLYAPRAWLIRARRP